MTTNYDAASLVAKLVSSKTPEHTHADRNTDKQHGTLKLNSVNAVELKNVSKMLTFALRRGGGVSKKLTFDRMGGGGIANDHMIVTAVQP